MEVMPRGRMNSHCEEIREQLSGYVDEETAPEIRRQIATHLEQCPACNDQEKIQRAVKGLLLQRPPHEPVPHHLQARVLYQLRTSAARPPFTALLRRLIEYRPVATFAMAGAALMLVATLTWWGGGMAARHEDHDRPLALQANSQMEGEMVCIDCELLNVSKTPYVHDARHRLGLRCKNGFYWNILQAGKGPELCALRDALHRQVLVKGHIFAAQHQIEVTDFTVI